MRTRSPFIVWLSWYIRIMKYFLAKTEPSEFSIDDFMREGETTWDGVHNHQAIQFIRKMLPGDRLFIYHSVKDKKVVGIAEVIDEPFENKDDIRYSWAVRLRFEEAFDGPTLADFKHQESFRLFKLVTNSRLSVMDVPLDIAEWILDWCAQTTK